MNRFGRKAYQRIFALHYIIQIQMTVEYSGD